MNKQERHLLFETKIYPLKQRPFFQSLLLISIIIIISIIFSLEHYFFGILAFICLFGATRAYFFPTYYFFYEDKIYVKTPFHSQSFHWDKFKSFHVDKNGVLLSPFKEKKILENFRGVYIIFKDKKNEEKIIEILKKKLNSYVKAVKYAST